MGGRRGGFGFGFGCGCGWHVTFKSMLADVHVAEYVNAGDVSDFKSMPLIVAM